MLISHTIRWTISALIGVVVWGSGCGIPSLAQAQDLSNPLYIGNAEPICDEMGRHLIGAASMPEELCDRVEILMTTNGVIYPPDLHGNPDPRNVVIPGGVTTIGAHTSLTQTNSGLFTFYAASNQPAYGSKLFVRVFNASTRDRASFYGDSTVFTTSTKSVYLVSVTNLMALDASDSDGDGVNNSWEKSYGSSPTLKDSDGDGLEDGEEVRAGTDPANAHSLLIVAQMRRGIGSEALVSWASVPGKRYQVTYSTDDLTAQPQFANRGVVVVAEGSLTEVTMPNGLASARGFYRVALVEN